MFHYQIDPKSSVPIYRQVVDQIHAQIHSGALKYGAQLPTVREMADKLHLSLGTVKRAYDCLQEMGDIEMTRRRGTFVKHVHRDRDSRKHQAMVAIDQMIHKMTELMFSPAEIQIFLNLKMREWGLKWTGVRVSVVTGAEILGQMIRRQLEEMPNVNCTVHSFRHLMEYPYSVDEGSVVILTLAGEDHAAHHVLTDGDKWVRCALCPDLDAIKKLHLTKAKRIGVLGGQGLLNHVKKWFGQELELTGAEEGDDLSLLDALLVPATDGEKTGRLQERYPHIPIIPFVCRLDEGSGLYLEERIGRMRDERQQWPCARGL